MALDRSPLGSGWPPASASRSQLTISYQWHRARSWLTQCRALLAVTATDMENAAHIDGGTDGVTWPSNQVVGEVRARARDHRQCALGRVRESAAHAVWMQLVDNGTLPAE
jgi:hypothetical protein